MAEVSVGVDCAAQQVGTLHHLCRSFSNSRATAARIGTVMTPALNALQVETVPANAEGDDVRVCQRLRVSGGQDCTQGA